MPERNRGVFDRLPEPDIAALRGYDLDVLLRFGFRILKGAVLGVPRHGVWSYHHGDPARFRGGPSCFREIVRGERSVGVVLQRLTETLDAGEILYRSTSGCAPTLRVDRVRGPHYLKSARFVRCSLERRYRTGSPIRAQGAEAQPLPPGPITRKPGNLRAAAVPGQMAVRTALANTGHLCRHDIWSIVLRQARPLLAPSAEPSRRSWRGSPARADRPPIRACSPGRSGSTASSSVRRSGGIAARSRWSACWKTVG